jgi:hypothetical protein
VVVVVAVVVVVVLLLLLSFGEGGDRMGWLPFLYVSRDAGLIVEKNDGRGRPKE